MQLYQLDTVLDRDEMTKVYYILLLVKLSIRCNNTYANSGNPLDVLCDMFTYTSVMANGILLHAPRLLD